MIEITCAHCGRTATIDNPEGWSCSCEIERLNGRISMLMKDIESREAEIISTMKQKTQLLPAVDSVLASQGRTLAPLPQDLASALAKLSEARTSAS